MHHGTLSFPETVCLEDLVPYATQFYNHRPRMIKIRKEGVTLLIFTSMKFRLLRKGDQHVQILHEFLQSLPWKSCISEMTTHMTVSHQLSMTNINLHKLDYRDFSVEMELFPAAKLRTIGATSDPHPLSQ